jgi:hypothetical protein
MMKKKEGIFICSSRLGLIKMDQPALIALESTVFAHVPIAHDIGL